MKPRFILAALALAAGAARAADFEASAALGSIPFDVGVALRDLNAGGDALDLSVNAGLSNLAAFAGARFTLDVVPAAVGRAGIEARLAYAFGRGVRGELDGRGTVGPAALNLRLLAWTADPAAEDPLAPFALAPDPGGPSGLLVGLDGSYRLSRALVLRFAPRYATPASWLEARLETRSSELSLSGGARLAFQPAGLTVGAVAGARYAPEGSPLSLSADGLIGVGPGGVAAGAAGTVALALPEDAGSLTAHLAFEPWREDVLALRYGADLELAAGPGTAYALAEGGAGGFGVRLGYRLSLDALFA